MKTYIFSNCRKNDFAMYGRMLLAKVPLDSRLILLNRGEVYYKVKEFTKYPNQNFIMRGCGTHGLEDYFGLTDLIAGGRKDIVNDVILFRPLLDKAYLSIGHKDEHVERKTIETPWMVDYHKATNGKYATTGYSAYYLVQTIYDVKPEDIVLVNFYGNNDRSTYKDSVHNWSYEDTWLKDKNRIYC